jgi:aminoglycoside phosphotransferase (APT) family kinase protein
MLNTMNEEIDLIINKHFNQPSKAVVRMTAGICNEVYLVKLENKSVIVRMNHLDRFLKGSSLNIPVFKSKGIPVPEILFEDYSKQVIPYAYQIMTVVEGDDLGKVIRELSPAQLKMIANEISGIFSKLADLPTNGKFGWIDNSDSKLVDSWFDVMQRMYYDIAHRNEETGVVGSELLEFAANLIGQYKSYFTKVPSKYVYDDLSSKNVIIKDGKFNGLVDLDQIMYGDFLDPVGRIKASWFGTDYGKIYTNAVIENLELNDQQKEMVTVYAVLSRISWLSEIGIQFNKNTSTDIDLERVTESKRIVELIKRELPG